MLSLYGAAFFLALAGGVVFVPFSIWIAKKMNVLDSPDFRKVHRDPVPRWGGLGLALSVFLSVGVLYFFSDRFQAFLTYRHSIYQGKDLMGVLSLNKQVLGIFFGSLFALGLGMWDDKFSTRASVKLLLQMIAAYIAMDYGVRLSGMALPWGKTFITFPLIVSQIITILWILGFMNTVNLADGMDGLAAGICAIAAGTFLVVAVLQGETQVLWFSKQLKLAGVLSAALLGACLSFLWFNFHPARVFMGDGGALFLGYMLATITVIGTLKTTAFFSLVIPIVVVALPILDVAASIFRRLRGSRRIMDPDKGHLHHQLLRHGWTHREVVLGIYIVTLFLSIFSILLTVFKGKI
jgi:UDP-GlcNAc:undecaprenyl-phosphate GlcNAc-1-phosphate transferase